MEHCPICRASLNGADTCRRCRADLGKVIRLERQSQRLAGAALHSLALGDVGAAARLLSRAQTIHAKPEIAWILSRIADGRISSEDSAQARHLR
jgi:uncharacterized protein HemY